MTATSDADRMRTRAGTRTDLPHNCQCGARWAGANTSHCGNCHDTFSGVSTFDRHRRDGRCVAPYHVGMSLIPGRAYDCWGYPADDAIDAMDGLR